MSTINERVAREANPRAHEQRRRALRFQQLKADPVRYAAVIASTKRGWYALRAWLFAYKLERGCVDCGYRANPVALQFDHEGEKTAEVSRLRSKRRILEEIERGHCVVRCANCHAVKTWERGQKRTTPFPRDRRR